MMMANRRGWRYALAFAAIDWLNASACLLTLGQMSPGWSVRFASWYALRKIQRAAWLDGR